MSSTSTNTSDDWCRSLVVPSSSFILGPMRRFLAPFALLVLLTATARADIPPLDSCNKEGETCDNAGNDGKAKGVCQKTRCSKSLPGPNGVETHEYDCLRCFETKGPAAAPTSGAKKGGCSVGGRDQGTGWLVAGAALALAARRRRRA